MKSVFFKVLFLWVLFVTPLAQARLTCGEIFSSPSSVLLQKIESLGDYQKIPFEVYEDYTVNDIAKALVSRIHQQEVILPRQDPSVAVDLSKNTDLILFFDSKNLESIIERGFLNQHQTKTSSAFYTPPLRKKVENTLTGLDLGYSPSAMQLRPKFAFLNIREPVDLTEKVDDLKGDYGSTGAVLKNEIKERSTWSTSDTNIIVMSHVGYRALPPEVRKHHGTFERGSLPSGAVDRSYYEAQVFGSLTISDVDYFLVSSPADAERLKPMRKPIYLLQSQEFHKRIVYKKGLCLFVGDSAL